jgi:hypothetical protein
MHPLETVKLVRSLLSSSPSHAFLWFRMSTKVVTTAYKVLYNQLLDSSPPLFPLLSLCCSHNGSWTHQAHHYFRAFVFAVSSSSGSLNLHSNVPSSERPHSIILFLFFPFFGGTGVSTQDLMFAMQVLYHLSHSASRHLIILK